MTARRIDNSMTPALTADRRTATPRASMGKAPARPAHPASAGRAARPATANRPARPTNASRPSGVDRPVRVSSTARAARQSAPRPNAAAKRPAAAPRRQRLAGLRFLALVALLALAAFLTKSRVFVLREVEVEGNRAYADSEIAAMAGLTPGESIFNVNEDAVTRNLSAHSDVKLLDFGVTYPDTVTLMVTERQARAAVNCAGVILIVDEEGHILDRLSSVPEGSIVVSGMDVAVSAQGRSIESAKAWQLKDMRAVLARMDEQGMLSLIAELNVADRYNLYLVSNTGVKIVLGDEENIPDKLVWARTVLEKLTQEGIMRGVLDVSTGKNAVYADR